MNDTTPPVHIGCAVVHMDSSGNLTPCPGYPLCSKAPGGPVEPVPQPECTQCHGFGFGVVQDAVNRLKESIQNDHPSLGTTDMEDIAMLISALEKHHE